MMLLLKEALGEDRIIGSQWMNIDAQIDDINKLACIDYIKDKTNPAWRQEQAESKDMNPNGFWECRWTVRGIQWEQQPPASNKVCKIVSQGLSRSNPEYIDKIVLMVRHPWAVANSQRNLSLNMPFAKARNKDIGNVSPNMYINVTVAVSRWILANQPQLLIVNYDDLISSPDRTIKTLSDFVGDGDWGEAQKVIQQKYNRSEPTRVDDQKHWDTALEIHEHFKVGDWQGVSAIGDRIKEEAKDTSPIRFHCPRWGGQVGNDFCTSCRSDDASFKDNLKSASVRRNIDWSAEPCLWECGMNPDRDTYTPLTIKESIAKNHWKDDNMKIRTIQKQDILDKPYAKDVVASSVGETEDAYILTVQKFESLVEKYGVTSGTASIKKDKPVKKTKKKKCSSCSRAKKGK
jgi:hypothetical protein